MVATDGLTAEVEMLARQLAAGPTATFGAAKRLLQLSWSESLETQMAYETETIAAIAKTPQAQEGMTAFVQKRAPVFHDIP